MRRENVLRLSGFQENEIRWFLDEFLLKWPISTHYGRLNRDNNYICSASQVIGIRSEFVKNGILRKINLKFVLVFQIIETMSG